jgi:hypothetical protein
VLDRRTFIRRSLAALGGVALMDGPWQVLSGSEDPPRVSSGLLADMERLNQHFLELRGQQKPSQLLDALAAHIDFMRPMRAATADLERQLHVVIAEAALQASSHARDVARPRDMRAFVELGLRHADGSGRPALRAAALAKLAWNELTTATAGQHANLDGALVRGG